MLREAQLNLGLTSTPISIVELPECGLININKIGLRSTGGHRIPGVTND